MRILLLMTALLLAVPLGHTAIAAGTESQPAAAPRDPDFVSGKKAVDAKDWKLALDLFGRALSRDPSNADIHNYIGYAYRKSGNLDAAFKSYGEALRVDPEHKGAHEYVGEAYLMVNDLAHAEQHLAALDRICFFSCEEFRDLKREIAEYKQKHAKN